MKTCADCIPMEGCPNECCIADDSLAMNCDDYFPFEFLVKLYGDEYSEKDRQRIVNEYIFERRKLCLLLP